MKISIEGYKSIADERSVNFCDLTILSGANSSGKSTFMQPLLLIKQTLENDFDAGSLMLDGPNVKINDSTEIVSKVTTREKKDFSVSMSNDELEVKATYKYRPRRGMHIDRIFHQSPDFKDGIEIHHGLTQLEAENLLPKDQVKLFKESFGKEQKIRWKVERERCFLDIKMLIGGKISPFQLGFDPARRLGMLATRLIHVPGLRGNPERSYKVASSEAVYPGSFERYVASIVHQWGNQVRHRPKFDLLKKQLNDLGLASSITTENINETHLEIRISRFAGCKKRATDFVNIADVGFGVSQTLPVLVGLLAAKKDQYVYVEQPELHLHPKAQFGLAQIIATAVVDRNVKVIIETHSSVLIRGIQILVAKGKINPGAVSLNWFTQNIEDGQTEIHEAKMDKYGAFGDWPADFDDVALTVEQMYLDAVEEAMSNEI